MKPPVEPYARVVYTPRDDVEFIVGLELKKGERFADLQHLMRAVCMETWGLLLGEFVEDAVEYADILRSIIELDWPDRYWFLEVHIGDKREGFVQYFQPPWQNRGG